MPKKYLIFAAVICLDLAFIVFMRLESPSVEVSQAFDPGNLNSVPFDRPTEDSLTPAPDEDLTDTQSPVTDGYVHTRNAKKEVDDGTWPSRKAGIVRKVR